MSENQQQAGKLIEEILQHPKVNTIIIEKQNPQTIKTQSRGGPVTIEIGAWAVTIELQYLAGGDKEEAGHPVTSWGKTLVGALEYAKESIHLVLDDPEEYEGWEIPPTNHL